MSLTFEERNYIKVVYYASAMGSLIIYAMLCVGPGICFPIVILSKCQSNRGLEFWVDVKHILKYFRRIIYYMLVSLSNEMILIRNKELDLLFDEDSCRLL